LWGGQTAFNEWQIPLQPKKNLPNQIFRCNSILLWVGGMEHRNKRKIFIRHYQTFISKNSDCNSLDDFANRLRVHLNNVVPKNLLKSFASGFHISGFDNNGWPHFLHISNVGKMEKYEYNELLDTYKEPYQDFQDRDAKKYFGWDGKNPKSAKNKGFIYRNGDIRTHVLVSKKFDDLMKDIFELPDFKDLKNHKELADYIKFKFDFIARLYEKWTDNKIVGKPIDVYVLTPTGILEQKNKKWQQLT
jgi:hypothetical protein